MIDLTVKTLDSQNHVFSVEDDQITVRGFKEYIAESVAVPADSQRLIYCGRVLQDEKKLNDYDVNGKVIHLVQRAPPQSTQQSNSGAQTQNRQNWQNSQRPQYRFTRTQMHGNAMYLGTAMSVPAEIVEGHGIPQLSNSLSGSRLQLAGRMLDRINELLDRLEDPNAPPLHPTPSELNQSTAQQQQAQAQESEAEQNENNDLPRDDGGVRFAEAAAAAITAALSAAGARAVTLFRGGNYNGANGRSTSDIDNESNVQAQSQPQAQAQSQQQQQQQRAQGATDAGTASATSSSAGQNRRTQQQELPRPQQMAELLQRLHDTQYRLRPHLERYLMLMLLDPRHPPGRAPNPIADSQRLVDGVSEILHFMAHACHALSDIIVDMNQRPPRNLRCRPILVQHFGSAFLQPSIPIQVEAHISLNGRTANSNNNDETSESGNQQTPTQSDNAEPATTPPPTNTDDGNQERESDNTAQSQTERPQAAQSPFSTVFNLPNNVEVLMEVSSENNIDGGSGNEQTAPSNDNNNGRMNSFPPGYLLRNFIHTMAAAHMAHSGMNIGTRNPPATTAGAQTILSSMDSGSTNTSQSTQARGNTGTHPTTATQTRSTSRPHVFHHHAHPVGPGMSIGLGLEFDPYLPCNSHHVYRTSTSATSSTTTATASSQTTQTAMSDAQNQTSQTATTSTTTTSATPTNTTSTNTETTSSNPSVNLSQPSQSAGAQSQTDINIDGIDEDDIAPNLVEDIRNMMLALSDQMRGGMLSESSMGMSLTLAGLFENAGLSMDLFASPESGERDTFLVDLFITLARNMSVDGLIRLRNGLWGPLSRLRWPLQVFLQDTFPNAPSSTVLQEQVIDRLLSQLRPHIRDLLASEEISSRNDSNVDLCATIESLIVRHTRSILKILFDNEIDNATFGREMLKIVTNLCKQVCIVLRHTLRGGEAGMEAIVTRLVDLMDGGNSTLRQWVLEIFINLLRTYLSSLPQPPDAEITPILIYKDASSSQQSTTVSSASTRQPAQAPQPEDEPMETESLEQQPTRERLVLEDREEILGTFPGHETLPSDWVPIIARDGVRQRRQLETQVLMPKAACMTTCSDAYLGGLPSKRRKLVEQQKPRLLVSPTPNHTSTVAASVERLIREGVGRAGVEEVEGAAVAVAADPAVQRAFGQAIRDCLFPYRYGTPDFPDPSRFPNATKYFANQDRPPK